MDERTESGGEFTVLDVSILVLEAVGVLHSRGHQLLRIYPGMSGSGMYWRTAVTHAANYTDRDGYTGLGDFGAAFHYTTGTEFEVAGERVDVTTTASELADRIVDLLPDPGVGRDWEQSRPPRPSERRSRGRDHGRTAELEDAGRWSASRRVRVDQANGFLAGMRLPGHRPQPAPSSGAPMHVSRYGFGRA